MKKPYILIIILVILVLTILGYRHLFSLKTSPHLKYKNSGGIAGICDDLEISSNGQYSYLDECKHKSKNGSLTGTDLNELNLLSTRYGHINTSWNDNSSSQVQDGFAGSLDFTGNGKSANEIAKAEIKTFAIRIISEVK